MTATSTRTDSVALTGTGPGAWLASLDERLVGPGSAHRLALVRTGLAVTIGLRLALRRWWVLSRQPESLFDPMLAVRWMGAMPSTPVLVALEVVGLAAAVAVVTGKRTAPAFVVLWVCYLQLAGLWSSAGKILHNDVLLILVSVPFLFAPGDARLGDRRTSTRWGWPPRAALAVVGLVYAATGVQKLRHSGLEWITGDTMRWILYQGAQASRSPAPGFARSVAGMPWLCHLLAAGAVLGELSAPVLLWFRRTRPWFLLSAVALHGGIWLTLGLDYWAWILAVAVVVLPAAVDGPPTPPPPEPVGTASPPVP